MVIERHTSRQAAATKAATQIAQALRIGLSNRQQASIAVSGGTTPLACYAHLATETLAWTSVRITPTDERCVPITHADSNAGMLRDNLLQNNAAKAKLIDMKEAQFKQPFAAVLLGMGEDGHFASIFPDSPNLSETIDTTQPPTCLPTTTAASVHKRQTLNLSALLHTAEIILLVYGEAKLKILEQPQGLPIQHLVEQQQAPVKIIWAE